jgi:hypothetical protein
MNRRISARSLVLQNALRAAIKTADTVRRAGPVALLCAALLSLGAVFMARATFANPSLWQSWTRLFGHPVPRPASDAGIRPEAATSDASNPGYTFTSFDAPGAGTSELEGTVGLGINASGTITGVYSNAMGVTHGFIRAADGTFTTFDAPDAGSTSPGIEGTMPFAVDSNGDVTGTYIDANHAYHGFVRSADGTITEFDAPGAPTNVANRGTTALGINDSGQIVGIYSTGSFDTASTYYGFVRAADGTVTTLTEPDAGSGENANGSKQGTVATAINASGEITGFYVDSSGNQHGFVLSAGGTYTSFDPAGSTSSGDKSVVTGTSPVSIDAAGDVAGSYTDSSSLRHGFVRTANGTITSFDAPGATTTAGSSTIGGTGALSIDPGGDYIAGIYTDSTGLGHGFIYSQPLSGSGTFTTFEATGASAIAGAPVSGTGGFSVNASGLLSGTYTDSSGVLHGFVVALAGPAATPTFSPVAGTYASAQTVTIGDTTPEATIYYTTDGTTPTTSSTAYSSPITVSSTETIEAIATASGYTTSAVASAAYTINLPAAATPTFSPAAGTYSSGQTVTISDATTGATIYYTTNGSTPTTSSTVYSGPISVSSSETIEAIAAASGYTTSAVASAAYTINLPATASPTFSPAAGTFTSAQSVTISDATTGATIYYTTNASTPTTSSTVYSGPISVSSSETIEAIAAASGYTTSAVASAAYTINLPANPTPVLSSLSPPFVAEGSAGFTLTVNGSGFVSGSTVYWGSTALTTTFGSATELTAPVTAAAVATAGTTSITVQTPAPGGGTSNALQFEVDSASSGSVTPPSFTTVTATVAPGSTASYPVTLPSTATAVSVSCLNLPSGATCSYSASTGAVTIATSATTPAGTYVITVVFAETLPGASSAWLLFPLLLLPLAAARRRWRAAGFGLMASLVLLLMVVATMGGCGGGSSSTSTPPPQTHQVTSSGAVTLTVQ